MGIKDLLSLLKPAIKPCHVSEYRGKKVAVDGNVSSLSAPPSLLLRVLAHNCVPSSFDLQVWIHRGAYSCALELHCGNDNAQYVGYCRSLAQMLLDAGVEPLVVFDGRSLGAKSETARRRAQARAQSVAAMDAEIEGMRELELRAEQQPASSRDSNLEHAIGAARARVETAAQRTIKVTAAMV